MIRLTVLWVVPQTRPLPDTCPHLGRRQSRPFVPSRSSMEAPAWCSVTGWHRHRHHAGPSPSATTRHEGWGLLPGHQWRPRPGHQRGLFHGHGRPLKPGDSGTSVLPSCPRQARGSRCQPRASPSRACSERCSCAASAGPHDASPSERGPGGPRHRRQRPRDLQPTSSDVNPRTRHLSRRSGPRSTRPRVPGGTLSAGARMPATAKPRCLNFSPRCPNGRDVRLRAPVPCVPVVGKRIRETARPSMTAVSSVGLGPPAIGPTVERYASGGRAAYAPAPGGGLQTVATSLR